MTLRLISTTTKIILTLEEVSPKHQECYEDLMKLLARTPVKFYGGAQ